MPHPRPSAAPGAGGILRDAFTRAMLLLIGVACVGAVLVGIVAARLTPADVPTDGGRAPATRGIPSLTRVPSHVETNGAPLTVTIHASTLHEDFDHRIARYLVRAQAPNAASAPITLCDSPTETDCTLPLNGSPMQRGIWVFTLTIADETGATTETRERMRVT